MNDTSAKPDWDSVLSNFNRHLQMKIVEWREGEVTVELTIADFMRNRHGIVHGGVISTLIDAAAGYAGNFCPFPGRKRLCSTISLTVSYMAPAEGGKLIARGKVRGGGRAIFASTVEVSDDKGKLLAVGEASLRWMKGSETLEGVPADS